MTPADEVVKLAVALLADRDDKYDNSGNPVLVCMADLMSAYFKEEYTTADAAMIMVLHKIARTTVDKPDIDHYADAAAYLSLAYKAVKD